MRVHNEIARDSATPSPTDTTSQPRGDSDTVDMCESRSGKQPKRTDTAMRYRGFRRFSLSYRSAAGRLRTGGQDPGSGSRRPLSVGRAPHLPYRSRDIRNSQVRLGELER